MSKAINQKGQIFSTDLMMASIVFLFILVLAVTYSNTVANRVSLFESDAERQTSAAIAANALVYSTGSPSSWENLSGLENVSSLGLVSSKNMIDRQKLQRLVDLNATNYDDVRALIGLSKYNVKISILRLQNKQSIEEWGMNPGLQDTVTAVNRIAFYNGENVIVRLKVFE